MMITWPMLKGFMSAKSLNPQVFEDNQSLILIVVDGTLKVGCQINKLIDQEYLADFEENFRSKSNKQVALTRSPFATNVVDGAVLNLKVHGVSVNCEVGANDFIFQVPYPLCKIYGLQVIGASDGDTADMVVMDTPNGDYTTVPNMVVARHGYSVGVAKDFFEQLSPFKRDLLLGIQLKLVLTATVAKKITVNFLITEAVPL